MDVIPKRCLSPKSIPKILTFLTLLLVPAATWREISFYILKRPDRLLTFFSQDKKWISVKIFFISKFLVKTKNVNFSFFTFSRLLMTTFSFLHILNFSNFVVDKSSKNSILNWRSNGLLLPYRHLLWCAYDLHNMFSQEWQLRTFTTAINLGRYLP